MIPSRTLTDDHLDVLLYVKKSYLVEVEVEADKTQSSYMAGK
jgi:hypothetical protein